MAPPSLVRYLQTLHRPAEVNESHFAALGCHVHVDAPAEQVIPEPSYLPSISRRNEGDDPNGVVNGNYAQRPLSNGRLSPEARVYLERRDELSTANQAAFRVVRRLPPEPGKPPIRLGGSYEFFRQLELMATYWDDTSLPPLPLDAAAAEQKQEQEQQGPEPQKATTTTAAAASPHLRTTYRTLPGSQMPAEIRHNMVSAFVKMTSYEFGCNISPPRVEPRLYLVEPPPPPPPTTKRRQQPPAARRGSYFSSGCVFLCRTPMTREAARTGVVEGPIAAVSARNTTTFTKPTESYIDLGREIIAALVTAQLRAREGKTEKRIGEGEWWATAKRWGGAEGGPIGREVEGDGNIVGDKDAFDATSPSTAAAESPSPIPSTDRPIPQMSVPVPVRGTPLSKKPRKTLSVYDRYRMVRPPSSNWDKKAKYEAIGKVRGSGHDDVFVVSSLFHHLCVLRVRVPDELLGVFEGNWDWDDDAVRGSGGNGNGNNRCRGLEIWRSTWFDLFIVEQRLEAMRLLWGVMQWSMRKVVDGGEGEDEVMTNA